MGKSVVRHYLSKKFPETCFNGRPPFVTDGENGTAVFEDVMINLKSFDLTTSDDARGPASLARCLKSNAEDWLNSTTVKDYFIVFDKPRYVRATKGDEQRSRDKKMKNGDEEDDKKKKKRKRVNVDDLKDERPLKEKVIICDGIPHLERRPYITLDGGFPFDWCEALSSRKETSQHVIQTICSWWLDETMDVEVSFQISPGTRIIIDGHNFNLELVKKLNITIPEGMIVDEEHICNTPICFEVNVEAPYVRKYFIPELQNTNGEADEAIFSLHYNLCRLKDKALDMVIFSRDTDFIMNSLVYLDKLKMLFWKDDNHLLNVFFMYDTNRWAFHQLRHNRNYEKWIAMNKLYDEIESYFTGFDHPVLDIVVAMILPGGDYNYPFLGIPHYHFLNAMFDHHDSIGRLVSKAEVLSPDSHLAFGIELTIEGYNNLIKTAFTIGLPRGKANEGYKADPDSLSVTELRELCNGYKSKPFPGLQTSIVRYLQLDYKMKIIFQIGAHSFIEPDPLKYGYFWMEDESGEKICEKIVQKKFSD